MLIGDTNGDKMVNSVDLNLTKGQIGMAVTTNNFREDVKVTGALTSADSKQVKLNVGHSLP